MANTLKKTKQKSVTKVADGVIVDKNGKNLYLCYCCGGTSVMERYTNIVRSDLWKGMGGHLPICKDCMYTLYNNLLEDVYDGNVKYAVRRICSMFDIYFNSEVYESSKKVSSKNPISNYLQILNSPSYSCHKGKTYNDTLYETSGDNTTTPINITKDITKQDNQDNQNAVTHKVRKFFGTGFEESDYQFLWEQYLDWTDRNEVEGKSQEELVKRLCFKQLEIYKATKAGSNTKDLDASFQSLLNSANLSPKQIVSDEQDVHSFGQLIQKLENTRPVADIDDELKDVDKIGLYIDVFFKGHLAKMMGLKNGLSRLYGKFMKKYTVEKPEYKDDETNEALFDAIFGNASFDDDDYEDYSNEDNELEYDEDDELDYDEGNITSYDEEEVIDNA